MAGHAAPYRILIAKPGLDGHDRGAKYVAHILRDAGYEVIHTGIRRTPDQIVQTGLQEDVRAIGISLLSGAHEPLIRRILELLEDQGADDIMVFAGGTIPPDDAERLREIGVKEVFLPGTTAVEIVGRVNHLLNVGK